MRFLFFTRLLVTAHDDFWLAAAPGPAEHRLLVVAFVPFADVLVGPGRVLIVVTDGAGVG